MSSLSWDDLKLAPEIREAIAAAGWAKPTQVQAAAIGPLLKGADVALQSRTGSGKTGAFVLPLLHRALLWQHALTAKDSAARGGGGHTKRSASAAAATSSSAASQPPIFLVLVPSVELCAQTIAVFEKLGKFVRPRCQVINLPVRVQQQQQSINAGGGMSTNHSASAMAAAAPIDPPANAALVLVSTPAFLVKAVKSGAVPLEGVLNNISALVVDEADMLTSHTSMQFLYGLLPSTRQSVLLSATLTESVARLKGALLNQPVAVRVDEEDAAANKEDDDDNNNDGDDDGDDGAAKKKKAKQDDDENEIRVVLPAEDRSKLKQYYLISTDECSKHTLLYSLFRFQKMLLPGKTLIFVDEEREPYRIQHFLEQLAVHALVYDLTLPVKARCDILTRFQEAERGVLICTDKSLMMAEQLQAELGKQTEGQDEDNDDEPLQQQQEEQEQQAGADDDDAAKRNSSKKKQKQQQQQQKQRRSKAAAAAAAEPGLSRGIDFSNVGNVILFQGVHTISDEAFTNYLHRVGRTARAGHEGQAITLFSVSEAKQMVGPLRDFLREARNEQLRPFKRLDRTQAAALQYRVQAAVQNVTRHAAKQLRVANVAAEMGRSQYLSTKLNTADTGVLRRLMSGATRKVRGDKNLRQVPEYMNINNADDTRDFERRVSARHLTAGVSRAHMFGQMAKKPRSNDPLSEVAARVRVQKRRRIDETEQQ